MTNNSFDCITSGPALSDISTLSNIGLCQAAANTPFCWPPNGTRICYPTRKIQFYWPPAYYNSDSKVAIEYNPTSKSLLAQNNTGNGSEYFTRSMYDREAVFIPGKVNEKSMKMYMREHRSNDHVDPWNLKVHEGPTVILVKTTHFTSTIRSAQATVTSRPSRSSYHSNEKDDGPSQSSGAIAGIVIGVLIGLFLLVICCSGWTSGEPGPNIDREEQARIAEHGTELMEQQGKVVNVRVEPSPADADDEVSRAEEARVPDYTDDTPPPKYTP